jgi:hypothetical protein
MGKKYPVVVIEHLDDIEREFELVYAWGKDDGMELVRRCLERGERIEAHVTTMTEKQYDSLPDYTGEC